MRGRGRKGEGNEPRIIAFSGSNKMVVQCRCTASRQLP